MDKEYSIYLDSNRIGTTLFEKADAPMGVVFGELKFEKEEWNYDIIKSYCKNNNIELADDYPEDKSISTRTIDSLVIRNEQGFEIKGVGNQISGMDSEGFEISIEGIAYPFYEEEFPHHVKAYNERFKG
ncbi:hypothetical protein [Roseivirga misakiensis]|uniref:Uncharacterized protein n=1 Tax=Roseivirga misakiensis TaxID=1563681 RepID=A0A1E5SYP4_9BACT|nr:hypothetical protein [Roseivirga misakiensis]OEK04236.1 hypothetical protein BFP71_12185 [Roseivirga misakiensis]